MPQPTPWDEQYRFADYAASNQPPPGPALDAEFDAGRQSVEEILRNLALIQRDDGRLANVSVAIDQLAPDVVALIGSAGFVVRGAWAVGVSYQRGDLVSSGGVVYLAMSSHVSAALLATDTAAGRMVAIFDTATDVSRSVVVPPGDAQAGNMVLPSVAGRANRLAGYDAAGLPVALTPSSVGVDAALRTQLALPDGAGLVGFNRSGGTPRTLLAKSRDRFDLRDFGVTGRMATLNEFTAEVNAALAQAKSEGVSTVFVEESVRIAGTITIPSGLAVVSAGGSTSYFDPLDFPQMPPPPGFFKPADGLNGPLVVRGIGDTMIGLTLEHQKVGGARVSAGGVMQMGPALPANNANNCTTERVTVIGHEIDYEVGGTRRRRIFGPGTPDCALVVFPATPVGTQRYHHIVRGLRLANAWIGLWLGNQANANDITGVVTGAVYRQIWMDGAGGEVLGNIIDGQWVGNFPLPTTVYTAESIPAPELAATQQDIKLLTTRNVCRYNRIGGYMENGGATVDADAASSAVFNDLSGLQDNWAYISSIPDAWRPSRRLFNENRRRGDILHVVPYAANYPATLASRDFDGFGARVQKRRVYTENLPLGNGGAFSTGAASRIFARWNQLNFVSKGARPSLRCSLRVQVNNPGGGAGVHVVEVEFEYRCVDNATQAGQLNVISVRGNPPALGYITSLVFIRGTTGTQRPFALGITLGNFAAQAPAHVFVSLEVEATTHTENVVPMDAYGDMTLAMEVPTSNDVTDAISLLATGTTAI